jgi:hypothetical protein
MRILRIGKNLTVVANDGTVITSTNCDENTFQEVYRLAETDDIEKIKKLLVPELSAQEQNFVEEKNLIDNLDRLFDEYPEYFVKQDNSMYRKGISLSIPKELAKAYLKAVEAWEEDIWDDKDLIEYPVFKTYDNFWSWCSLNPNPQSREDLFTFLKTHGMPITSQGMFLAYRRVRSQGTADTKEFVEFISNTFLRTKGMWKKDPKEYLVYKLLDGTYSSVWYNTSQPVFGDYLGTLDHLYTNLADHVPSQFTDNHTGRMDYRIGLEARMERSEGDQSNEVSCSRGLHVASKAYDYSGFGDTPILVVVNPRDVLAVPQGEDGKLRTCAFTPVAVLEEDQENQILEDPGFDCSELLMAHYEDQVKQLQELVQNNSPAELHQKQILSSAGPMFLHGILRNVEAAKQVVGKRITYLYS